jgi:peptidoglycan/xylan/chitin deacetylase (PgdA/CDA1 family)
MVRRLSFLLVLFLIVTLVFFWTPLYGSSEGGYTRVISPVEAGTAPGPPDPPDPRQPDMEMVWDSAITQDSSPDLATHGRTGTSGRRIALTFDDGPDPRTTPRILATLRESDLKATFFVLGRQVDKRPGLLRRIVEEGHTIGNHTYNHADMSDLSRKRMQAELRRTQEAVDDALGYHYPMVLMRPPYGNPYLGGSNALPEFQKVVREHRLFPILWTIDPRDYLLGGHPQGVVRGVVRADETGRKRHKDQVLLLHDTHRQTADALPQIIDHYEGSGRRFADVGVLLADKYAGP